MDTRQATRPIQDGEDHWAWRPDWTAERECTFWYLTIPEVRVPGLEDYVDRIGAAPWLDVVPPRWWHLTLTEIGYAEDVDDQALAQVATAVAALAGAPLRLELGPVVRFRTALALAAGPAGGLADLQAAVRAETRRVLGPDHAVVHPKRFRPHVSLAYVNRDVPGDEVAALLADAPDVRTSVAIDRLTLAAVTRQERHYRWRVVEEVRLT